MQIYERKSAEFLNFVRFFLNFVRGMGGFEGIEWMDSENYSDNNATRRL